jgi:hypothetical protein
MVESEPHQESALRVLTTVTDNTQGMMIAGELEAAGIRPFIRPGTRFGIRSRDVCVLENDLARAREVLNATPLSDEELIEAEEEAEATLLPQPTGTKAEGGPRRIPEALDIPEGEPRSIPEPVHIPAQKRHVWKRLLKRATQTPRDPFGRALPKRSDE